MPPLSNFVERLLLQPGLLGSLTPSEPLAPLLPARIAAASDEVLSGGAVITDEAVFKILRGALFYAMDALEAAHRLFQEAPGSLSAYAHGMLHRREADFDNARYWFRRAGRQPFFPRLHRSASQESTLAARQVDWDPYLFTGLCEQARHGATEGMAELLRLQRAEFDAFLDYSWRQSLGS